MGTGRSGISRKQFLAGLGAGAATTLLTACQSDSDSDDDRDSDDDSDTATEDATGQATGRQATDPRHRGVLYHVTDGEHPGTGWDVARMREDLRAIQDELHANALVVYGDGVERLAATATEAAERGLRVWLQPRLGDRPQREILDHLAETGRHAEELRRQDADVHLSVGCEFVLFTPGIAPGADVLERLENIAGGDYDPVELQRNLTDFIGRAATTGRSAFDGRLTYGAAHGDEVDWDLFDVVSVNYYADHGRRSAGYADDLRRYRRWDKPVAITEFGSCTYEGAAEAGGMGWDVMDYATVPPTVAEGLVRSERAQATYLADALAAFESLDLHATLVYEFVTPDAPHRPQTPRHDEDMAGYALVRTVWETPESPGAWHWEPKRAFHAVADHYRAAAAAAASAAATSR